VQLSDGYCLFYGWRPGVACGLGEPQRVTVAKLLQIAGELPLLVSAAACCCLLLPAAACCLLLPAAPYCCLLLVLLLVAAAAGVVLLSCCCNQTAPKARNKQPDILFETHPKQQTTT